MKHRFCFEAQDDLQTAAGFYDDRASLGSAFNAEVFSLVSIIEANPRGFAPAPRCPKGRDIRVVKIGQFDYLMYHEVLTNEVVTICIQHARRKSAEWRKRTP